MGRYDVITAIEYILTFTSTPKLAYVGHSEGTIQMFASLTLYPELLSKYLYSFTAFGPVVAVGNQKSEAMKLLAEMDLAYFIELFGINDFLPPAKSYILKLIFAEFCYECELCCEDVVELICGPHQGAFNASRMPVVATHEPGGTSVQNMMHWSQMVLSGLFQAFDYGSAAKNREHYNSSIPTVYDLSKIPLDFPIGLWSGGADLLADPVDVAALAKNLGPRVKVWDVIPSYAHLDFVWATDAHKVMYPDVLQFIAGTIL